MITLDIEMLPGYKCDGDILFLVHGELVTMHDLLYLVQLFHKNEIKIIKNGKRFEDGSPFPDWFGRALRLIADNDISFEEICETCHIPGDNMKQHVEYRNKSIVGKNNMGNEDSKRKMIIDRMKKENTVIIERLNKKCKEQDNGMYVCLGENAEIIWKHYQK